MLASLLINGLGVRDAVVAHFLSVAGVSERVPRSSQETFVWEFETETDADGKRNDLRITARDPDSGDVRVLIIVEVKVDAGFHESAGDGETARSGSSSGCGTRHQRHQIANYDQWLTRQRADVRAGVVPSMRDMTNAMPSTDTRALPTPVYLARRSYGGFE